jgi:predicted AAA+ superfamily ATPase
MKKILSISTIKGLLEKGRNLKHIARESNVSFDVIYKLTRGVERAYSYETIERLSDFLIKEFEDNKKIIRGK